MWGRTYTRRRRARDIRRAAERASSAADAQAAERASSAADAQASAADAQATKRG